MLKRIKFVVAFYAVLFGAWFFFSKFPETIPFILTPIAFWAFRYVSKSDKKSVEVN